MSYRTTVKIESGIFDRQRVTQAVSNAVNRSAIEFAELTRRRQIEGPQTGRLYPKRRGPGFRRAHRASARGERPAVDTGRQLNSTKHVRTGDFSAEVTTKATRDGFDYSAQLQFKMDRPIQSDSDAKDAEAILARNIDKAIKPLL